MYNEKKRKSAPTISRNICCINGKLVLATKKTLIELDLRKLLGDEADNWKTFLFSNYQLNVKRFEEDHCRWVDIMHGYQFINFTDTGTGGTVMIIENETSK